MPHFVAWHKEYDTNVAGPRTSTNLLVEVLYNSDGDPILTSVGLVSSFLYNVGIFNEKFTLIPLGYGHLIVFLFLISFGLVCHARIFVLT